MTRFRVFISAVSSEFGQARKELSLDFRTRRIDTTIQEELSQLTGAKTLLQLLDNHIQESEAVVCVIGRRSGGGFPTDIEVTSDYAKLLPPGMPRASYTQWEYLLARHHGKTTVICCPRPGRGPAPDKRDDELVQPDDTALQATFVQHIVASGAPRNEFSDTHELCRLVMRQPWVSGPAGHKPIVLPYPSLGTLFKGRDTFMERLRASLARDGGGTTAVVHGLGGVGKTRAAVEYGHAHAHEYTAVALLEAETPDKLRSSLAQLIGPLRLTGAPPEEDARVEAAIQWLNDNPGWFLILDNIDTGAALQAAHALLGRLRGGHVVLTSRLAELPAGLERLDLDVLTPEHAVEFLDAATPHRRMAPDDTEQAVALAGELGQLALALTMAAATIEARKLTYAAYRTLWQGNRARVIGWAGQAVTGYHHAVAETWQTSVDQLSPEALALLERLCFLAPDPIPETLLDVPIPATGSLVVRLWRRITSPRQRDMRAALDELTKYSLATVDPDSGGFLVHRLVQDVTRRGLERTDRHRPRLTEALGQVYAAFAIGAPDDVRVWPTLDPLAPHAEAVAAHADTAGIAEPTVDVLGRLDQLFDAKARHGRAEVFSRRALAIAEASFPANDTRIAAHLNNLATLLQATNRLGEAEPLMRRHLAIFLRFQRDTGHAHPHRDAAIGNYWGLLEAMGKSEDEIVATIRGMVEAAGISLG